MIGSTQNARGPTVISTDDLPNLPGTQVSPLAMRPAANGALMPTPTEANALQGAAPDVAVAPAEVPVTAPVTAPPAAAAPAAKSPRSIDKAEVF